MTGVNLSAFAGLLAVVVLVCGVLYGCDRAGKDYYAAMRLCTEQGGSWVPVNSGTYSASCVYGRSKS
jgi:hypothetical protein